MRKKTMRLPVAFIIIGLVLLVSALCRTNFNVSRLASAECEMKRQAVSEPFDRIIADTANLNVVLTLAPDGVCEVEYPEGEAVRVSVQTKDGALIVSQEEISFFPFNILPAQTGFESVNIRLSARAYSSLAVSATSGDVSVSNDFSFQSARVRTTSGNVDFCANAEETSLSATSGRISACGGAIGQTVAETSSGDIRFENVQASSVRAELTSGCAYALSLACAGDMEISTCSGSIRLESANANGALTLKSTSGKIDLERVQSKTLKVATTSGSVCAGDTAAGDSIYMETTSGDIRLTDCDAQTVSLKCTSGSVDAVMATPKRVIWKTTSGSVSVPDDADGEKMNVSTTSGSIRVAFR